MPRKRDERIDQARAMYLEGRKLVEIANQLDLPEGTIRSWKNRYKWDCNVANGERNVANRKTKKKEAAADMVSQVIANPGLTDKQRLFCVLYIRCFNATKAYQKAYGCSYDTANTEGYKLLVNPGIKEEIKKLKQNRLNREMLDESDIFQKYMDIAFADITDYVTFGREEALVMGPFGPIQVKDKKTGEQVDLKKEVNVVKFRESTEVDGTLISEVKQGKDGASIKLADRMKALQWLSDHMDLATEEQRTRIDMMRARAQLDDTEEMEDDGFLEALKGTAAEDWNDEA